MLADMAGHGLAADKPELFNRLVVDFLTEDIGISRAAVLYPEGARSTSAGRSHIRTRTHLLVTGRPTAVHAVVQGVVRWPPCPPASGLASPPLGGQGRADLEPAGDGLLGQVDSEGEPKIGPAVDDVAEAAA
jgi:hypothetical protein